MASYWSESRYHLRVQLTGITPPIWRRIVVPGAISFHTLHRMLQVVMGWENTHVYLFRLRMNKKTTLYGLPDPDWELAGVHVRDSRRAKLDTTVWIEWMELTYDYGLAEGWTHQIRIESRENLTGDRISEDDLWVTPRCLAGERACPPEGAGGVEGYAAFLEALRNPEHPEHERLRQWVGASYDPEICAIRQINSALAVLA